MYNLFNANMSRMNICTLFSARISKRFPLQDMIKSQLLIEYIEYIFVNTSDDSSPLYLYLTIVFAEGEEGH